MSFAWKNTRVDTKNVKRYTIEKRHVGSHRERVGKGKKINGKRNKVNKQ